MWVYYILLLIPLTIQHFIIKGNRFDYHKKNQRALLFFFVMMTILVALRHESIGTDTRSYIYYFERFSKLSWEQCGKESIEWGFTYFNKIISLFTKEPQVFLAITAIVTIVMIYPTYRRLCVDSSLTIVLYVTMSTFVMVFSGIRQMLAIGIGFLAYECTRNKKLIPFIFCVILAVMFHTSAFVLVFMYPLYHAKITNKWLIVVVPVLTIVFVFNRQIFSALGFLLARFTQYDASIGQTGAFTMLILFAIFAVFVFLIPKDTTLDAETIGLRNFLLLSVILQMFAPLHTIAMRINYYYIIFIPLLLPKIIQARSSRWDQVAIVSRHVMVMFFLVYFFFNAYIGSQTGGGSLNTYPYIPFWVD